MRDSTQLQVLMAMLVTETLSALPSFFLSISILHCFCNISVHCCVSCAFISSSNEGFGILGLSLSSWFAPCSLGLGHLLLYNAFLCHSVHTKIIFFYAERERERKPKLTSVAEYQLIHCNSQALAYCSMYFIGLQRD